MNNLKHTPGPWGISENSWLKEMGYGDINSKKWDSLAVVCTHNEEGKANAKLIAAAPKMLECLINEVKHSYDDTGSYSIESADIIEKATGLKIEEIKLQNNHKTKGEL